MKEKKSPFWLHLTVSVCVALAVFFIVTSFGKSDSGQEISTLNPAWYTPETARGEYRKNAVMVGKTHLEMMNKMIKQMAKEGVNLLKV
jgi:hypothetical protein